MRQIRLLPMLLLFLLLNGCGFHLRGYDVIPPQLKTLSMQTTNRYDEFTLLLRKQLQAFGVTILNNPTPGVVNLVIKSSNFGQNLTAISENSQVRTYTLIATVVYQFENANGKILLGPETRSETTSYTTNDNQLLGDAEVLRQARAQLYSQLVFLLLNRLHSASAEKILLSQTEAYANKAS